MGIADGLAYIVLFVMVLAVLGVLGWLALDHRKLVDRVGSTEKQVSVVDEATAARLNDVSAYFNRSLQGVQGNVSGLGTSMSNAITSVSSQNAAAIQGVSSSNAAAISGLKSSLATQVDTQTLTAGTVEATKVKATSELSTRSKLLVNGTVITAPSSGSLLVQGADINSKATLASMALQVDGAANVGTMVDGGMLTVGGSNAFQVYTNPSNQYASLNMGAGAVAFRAIADRGTFSLQSTSSNQNLRYASMSNNVIGFQAASTFGAPITLQSGLTMAGNATTGNSNCIAWGGSNGGTMCFAKGANDAVQVGNTLGVSKAVSVGYGSNAPVWPVSFSNAGLSVAGGGLYASSGMVGVGVNGSVAASLARDGTIAGARLTVGEGVAVTNDNPGPMIQKQYNGQGERYGVGQFPSGTMRMYAGAAYPQASLRMGFAKADGSFTDIVTLSNPGPTGTASRMTVAGDVYASGNNFNGGNGTFGLAKDTQGTVRAFGSANLNLSRVNGNGTYTDVVSVGSDNVVQIRGSLQVCDAAGNNCRSVAVQ